MTTGSPAEDPRMPVSLPHNLAAAGQAIDMELRRKPNKIMTLTSDAGDALADAHADCLADLGREAIRIARNAGLSVVDRVHVEQAVGRLGMGSSQNDLATVLLALGGAVAGGGISLAWVWVFNPAARSTAEVNTTLVLCVFGAVLLAVGITLTLVRQR